MGRTIRVTAFFTVAVGVLGALLYVWATPNQTSILLAELDGRNAVASAQQTRTIITGAFSVMIFIAFIVAMHGIAQIADKVDALAEKD